MNDPVTFSWIVMYSSIGLAYILYGLKRSRRKATMAGIALCLIPHLISINWLLLVLGIGLIALPMIWRD